MKDVVIDNVIKTQTVEDYFYFFEEKDLSSLEGILSLDCSLTDWEIGKVSGKDNVMEAFSNIFSSFEKITVDITDLHEDPDTIVCEMVLNLDGQEFLVADVIDFDDEGLIKSIRAYKGN